MMNDNPSSPIVSVLVSCYNVERHLSEFFQNIEKQSFKDYEIIFVDDGSTDDTLKIIRRYAHNKSNVKVLAHSTNKGLGTARNTGINEASGKYIYFCDVDDEFKIGLLEYCSDIMNADSNIDFIIFGFDVMYPESHHPNERIIFNERKITDRQGIRDNYVDLFLMSPHGNGFVWNKFYRKSFIIKNGLRFGTQKIQQDEVFNIKAIQSANCIYVSPVSLYKYNIFITGNNGSRYIHDRFEIFSDVRSNFENLFEKWGLKNDTTEMYINKRFYGNIMKCLHYDLTHPNCNLTNKEKRARFYQITSHPYSQTTKRYLEHNPKSLDIQQKILLRLWNNYFLFYLLSRSLDILYKCYKTFRKK